MLMAFSNCFSIPDTYPISSDFSAIWCLIGILIVMNTQNVFL